MKRDKRFCRVVRNHPLTDLEAIEDDLLHNEVHEDQHALLKKMHKVHRMKAHAQFLLMFIAMWLLLGVPGATEATGQANANPFAQPYQNLDPSMIPSGLLHNRSPWYHNAFDYDTLSHTWQLNHDWKHSPYLLNHGVIETPAQRFLHLYKEMLFAQIHDSVIPNPILFQEAWDKGSADFDVPISLMLLDFHHLPEDAIVGGKVWFDTLSGTFGPYPDTLWMPDTLVLPDTTFVSDSAYFLTFPNPDSLLESAFQRVQLSAMMMKNDLIFAEGTTISILFGIPEYLAIHNLDTLPDLLADFDDGLGFRQVLWGSGVQVVYNLPAYPRIHELAIRLSIPGQRPDIVLVAKLTVVVNAVLPDMEISTNDLPIGCEILPGSTAAEGRLSIRYADPLQPVIQKPVLFVEGFETALHPYGDITFMNIMNELMPSLGFPEVEELPLLFDSLQALGYDLIFLDFINSRDSLERNTLAIVRAIEWINEELHKNGSNEKLVIASASMGGVITRYALRLMELNNCCHNTRLWISFDSPHQGANIPVGVQHLVEYAATTSAAWKGVSWPLSWVTGLLGLEIDLKAPSVELLHEKVLNSPAARTMLIQHVEPNATTQHLQFYETLNKVGYPQYCRKIALINGSERGVKHQLDDPHGRIMGTGVERELPESWKIRAFGLNYPSLLNYFPRNKAPFQVAFSVVLSEEEPYVFGRNDWLASIETLNNITITTGVGTGINMALGGAAIAAAANMNLPLVACLEGSMIVNKCIHNKWMQKHHTTPPSVVVQNNGLLPLSTAPGGLNDALKKLGGSMDGSITAYSQKFSFIPSISALDVKNLALDGDIESSYIADFETTTPFDAYWAPRRIETNEEVEENELHVEVSVDNRSWIIDHIENEYLLRQPNGQYNWELLSKFNFSRPGLTTDIIYVNQPYHNVLYSADVLSGGELLVNAFLNVGSSNSQVYPRPGGFFRLVANGDPCDPAVVRVKDGGLFSLGDPVFHNTAEVVFSPNTTLELFPGSMLDLHGESRLVIADGATLIVHPGANVVLHHQESVLEIQGRLVLVDGAQLSVNGPGYIRYNAPMTATNYQSYFSVGSQAGIELLGAGPSDRKLQIASDTWFPHNLPVTIHQGGVTLEENVSLFVTSPIHLENVWVRAEDTATFYGALVVYGQKGMVFRNSSFTHGETGLKGNLSVGGSPMILDGCVFRNNITGLHTVDEKVQLLNTGFYNNHQNGWFAENMSGYSKVERSHFSGNGNAGIHFSGQLTSGLLIRGSVIENNHDGVIMSDGTLQAQCSEFTNNTHAGLFARHNARILLGNQSKNRFTGNYIGLALDRALELDLYNGHLLFSGNNHYVIGELLPNLYFELNTPLPVFDLSGNHMPVLFNAIPVHLYIQHPITETPMSFPLFIDNMVHYGLTACTHLQPSLNEHLIAPIMDLHGASVIQGGKYHNHLFTYALYHAASMVSCDEYTGNDTAAIAALSDLLLNLPISLNESEQQGADYALHLMTLALGNAIELGLINPARGLNGESVDEYVDMIAQRVQEKVDDVDAMELYAAEMEARYALMKAQMYRVAEHYDHALAILENRQLFSGTPLISDAEYWRCVCEVEQLLLKDSLDQSAFHHEMDSCSLHLNNARRRPFMPLYGEYVPQYTSRNLNVKKVYPNPANRRVVVEFTQNVPYFEAELTDPSGRSLMHLTRQMVGARAGLDLPPLPRGVYVLKVRTPDDVSFHKIMINQQ